jgi:hypothetical protein
MAWLFAVLALICLVKAAPAGAQTVDQGRAEFHETYNLDLGGTVSITNISGYIRVTSWNENRVQVDAVKRSRRSEDLSLVEIQVNARPERIEIRTNYPRFRSSNISVDYDVKVPRSAVLNSVTSISGEITVTGRVARVIAGSTSGSVTVRDVSGDANLKTTSGRITADQIGGALTINTTSGELQINNVGAQLNAHSTSGQIRAIEVKDNATARSTSGSVRLERIGGRVLAGAISGSVTVNDVSGDVGAESTSNSVVVENVRGRVTAGSISGRVVVRNVEDGVRASCVSGSIEITNAKGRIEASGTSGSITLQEINSNDVLAGSHSGGVRFQGKLGSGGRYEFTSFSGEVLLLLPADSSFSLIAKTSSGGIETDFPIQLEFGIQRPPRRLQGRHGSGGAQITATSFSGSIRLKKQ